MHNSQRDDQHRKDVEHFAALRALQHSKVGRITILHSNIYFSINFPEKTRGVCGASHAGLRWES